MISEKSIIKVTDNQVSGELHDGDVAILNLKDGVYYGLNAVGGRIWSLIQQPKTVAEIRDTLLQEFEVTREQCIQDLIALLQELSDRGLIEVHNGSTV